MWWKNEKRIFRHGNRPHCIQVQKMWKGMVIMQLFEDLVKCKDCMNNINSKCILYPGKDAKEENTGCYVGIDRNNKQKIVGGD
nr:MAG TPA: hypothetical protein [Caudoviricetes sp.]DAY02434.1 MAG TPA: hypothetical protein [Caudoviricetes sp.]